MIVNLSCTNWTFLWTNELFLEADYSSTGLCCNSWNDSWMGKYGLIFSSLFQRESNCHFIQICKSVT